MSSSPSKRTLLSSEQVESPSESPSSKIARTGTNSSALKSERVQEETNVNSSRRAHVLPDVEILSEKLTDDEKNTLTKASAPNDENEEEAQDEEAMFAPFPLDTDVNRLSTFSVYHSLQFENLFFFVADAFMFIELDH